MDPLISLAGESPRGKCMLNHIRYSLATLNVPLHGRDFDGICTLRIPFIERERKREKDFFHIRDSAWLTIEKKVVSDL